MNVGIAGCGAEHAGLVAADRARAQAAPVGAGQVLGVRLAAGEGAVAALAAGTHVILCPKTNNVSNQCICDSSFAN